MNQKVILKITGLVLGPVLLMAVGIYAFYPSLNQEKYEAVVDKFDRDRELPASGDGFKVGRDFQTLTEQVKLFRAENKHLQTVIDSLRSVTQELNLKLREEARQDSIDRVKEAQIVAKQEGSGQTISSDGDAAASLEDLSEKVKGLLSLDEENLAPIVNKMNDEQLYRLFRQANTIQQKKLLRSLESERAAKLMSRVML